MSSTVPGADVRGFYAALGIAIHRRARRQGEGPAAWQAAEAHRAAGGGALRILLEPHLAAVAALACATRANAMQIGSTTMADVQLIGASLASGHRLAPAFVRPLAAQILARRQQDADGQDPLFLTPDSKRAATVRHVNNWLARVGRETGLRFDRSAGWNRYTTPAWARFRRLESCQLLAIPQRRAPR